MLTELSRQGRYYSYPISWGIEAVGANKTNLRVDNSEISGWGHAGVKLEDVDGPWIHHNYFHHNHRRGLGYGVVHRDATSLIERNLFDYNRHSIAATGQPGDGYEARHNVILEHANVHGHAFDMHGWEFEGERIAGDWLNIHHNQFRLTHEEAVRIRGTPREGAEIYQNWFFHDSPGSDVVYSPGNTQVYDNVYGSHLPESTTALLLTGGTTLMLLRRRSRA